MTLVLLHVFACATLLLALAGLSLVLHATLRHVSRVVSWRLGWRAMGITGWLGSTLHQGAHILVASLFRHRIVGFSIFEPDPVTGTPGYVRHAHQRATYWQRCGYLFVGLAPVSFGMLVLCAIWTWGIFPAGIAQLVDQAPMAIGGEASWQAVGTWLLLALRLGSSGTWWQIALQLFLAGAVALHMAPSWQDVRRGMWGVPLGLLAFALWAWSTWTLSWLWQAAMVVLLVCVLSTGAAVLLGFGGAALVRLLTQRSVARPLAV